MRLWAVCCLTLLWSAVARCDGFGTQETVELVILCMDEIGSQSEENLYTCACRHDYLTAHLGYDAYERATMFERYRNMPADKGQLFRDSKEGDELIQKLKESRKQAATECPIVKQIAAPEPPPPPAN